MVGVLALCCFVATAGVKPGTVDTLPAWRLFTPPAWNHAYSGFVDGSNGHRHVDRWTRGSQVLTFEWDEHGALDATPDSLSGLTAFVVNDIASADPTQKVAVVRTAPLRLCGGQRGRLLTLAVGAQTTSPQRLEVAEGRAGVRTFWATYTQGANQAPNKDALAALQSLCPAYGDVAYTPPQGWQRTAASADDAPVVRIESVDSFRSDSDSTLSLMFGDFPANERLSDAARTAAGDFVTYTDPAVTAGISELESSDVCGRAGWHIQVVDVFSKHLVYFTDAWLTQIDGRIYELTYYRMPQRGDQAVVKSVNTLCPAAPNAST